MKTFIMGMSAVFIIAMTGGVLAQGISHDMAQTAPGGGMNEMDHSDHSADLIQEDVVDGYRFSYRLTDIREKMAAMKEAGQVSEGMDETHHLMVYIENPEGLFVRGAQVGFLVEGESGEIQKLMCMEMGDGYGSDVNLGGAGKYIVKTKVVAGDVKLMDEFTLPGE